MTTEKLPRVVWIASPKRPGVRHCAEWITLEYVGGRVFAVSLCGKTRVWVTDPNDFNEMHECGKCHAVLTDDRNSERFFGIGASHPDDPLPSRVQRREVAP